MSLLSSIFGADGATKATSTRTNNNAANDESKTSDRSLSNLFDGSTKFPERRRNASEIAAVVAPSKEEAIENSSDDGGESYSDESSSGEASFAEEVDDTVANPDAEDERPDTPDETNQSRRH